MFKNIVLATDGSAASENAIRKAVDLAASSQGSLTAVYVADPYPYLGFADTNPAGLHAYLSAARDHAAQAHAKVLALGAGKVDVQPVLVEDAAAVDGIVRTAVDRGADLIVVGSHGRGGFQRFVLGSVAAKVVARSPVPVLVVPGEGTA